MLVHLVHRHHTLSLLGMQSLYRGAAVLGLLYGIRHEASRSGWDKIVHGQSAPSLILIVSLSL
jgi:hypothetical protein